jgi:hypothetical protein
LVSDRIDIPHAPAFAADGSRLLRGIMKNVMRRYFPKTACAALAILGLAAVCGLAVGCANQRSAAPSATPNAAETPLLAESNPPGDIPDSQAFIVYVSRAEHYRIDAPEGWARSESHGDVTFADKFNGESVASPADCATGNRSATLSRLIARRGGAPAILRVQNTDLPAGPAAYADYSINSSPEQVTGKRIRLGANAYLIRRWPATAGSGGSCVLLTLWAPLGSDNVDQWKRIARSFRW